MTITRRRFVQGMFALGAANISPRSLAGAGAALPIRLNIPGPGALPFLPVDLIPKLGLDRKLGVDLYLRYFPSGVQAAEDMLAGNAHFAGLGFSVLPRLSAKGMDIAAIAPLSGESTPYAIIARADLRGKVRTLADLKGRSIGASVGSVNSKTYMQQITELLLKSHGVEANEVRWVGTAQNMAGQQGALSSGIVDAVFCEEPFVSALLARKLGYLLYDMTNPKTSNDIPGAGHLRATIAAARTTLEQDPRRAELMVEMIKQSLAWIHGHSPEAIAERLRLGDAQEKAILIGALKRSTRMHSPDGRFSQKQIEATRAFHKATGGSENSDLAALVNARWAGQKP